jgi:hypothetical protein
MSSTSFTRLTATSIILLIAGEVDMTKIEIIFFPKTRRNVNVVAVRTTILQRVSKILQFLSS